MELIRLDTQKAYDLIHERIVTLKLKPGAPINDQELADELSMGLTPVQEGLKLLVHDHLVDYLSHGLYVSKVSKPDLDEISELRVMLEGMSARLAAERASQDQLTVLEVLCEEQKSTSPEAVRKLFDIDHKFHQVLAKAAHNRYLEGSLEMYFGLSQRLWYIVLPHIGFLASAVNEHLIMVKHIKAGEGEEAEYLMQAHVRGFYDKVKTLLENEVNLEG